MNYGASRCDFSIWNHQRGINFIFEPHYFCYLRPKSRNMRVSRYCRFNKNILRETLLNRNETGLYTHWNCCVLICNQTLPSFDRINILWLVKLRLLGVTSQLVFFQSSFYTHFTCKIDIISPIYRSNTKLRKSFLQCNLRVYPKK